jgi:hypothetical protein
VSRATIIKEETLERDRRFLAILIETKNAVLLLLSEGEDQLGTLAASVPSTSGIQTHPALSSLLLGERHAVTARMLAERLSTKTGKIGLASVYVRGLTETEATPTLMRLFQKVVSGWERKEKLKEEHTSG